MMEKLETWRPRFTQSTGSEITSIENHTEMEIPEDYRLGTQFSVNKSTEYIHTTH